VRELDFCAPIRAALQSHSLDVSRLNLRRFDLRSAEDILIIEASTTFSPRQRSWKRCGIRGGDRRSGECPWSYQHPYVTPYYGAGRAVDRQHEPQAAARQAGHRAA